MNIVILEDERLAAQRLEQLLRDNIADATVVAVLESIADASKWFAINPLPDLILSDIHLGDGLSFGFFSSAQVNVPVIFTTAYDDYMLRAFKLNSIDYLLKPVDKDELTAAFAKYRSLYAATGLHTNMQDIMRLIAGGKTQYKSRFLVRHGERLIPIPVDQVAFIRADDKIVFLHTKSGQKYIIDDHLDALEPVMDPDLFFRINRTYLVPLTSIEKIHTHLNGRLKVSVAATSDDDIFVSKARAAVFKKWLGR